MGRVIDRRRVMGGKKLPYDAEIEFLQGAQGTYIKTGIIVNSDNWRRIKIEFDGSWVNANNNRWRCHGIGYYNPTFYVSLSEHNRLSYGSGGNDASIYRTLTQQEYTSRHKYIVDYVLKKISFDDEVFDMALNSSTNLNHEFYIFTWNSRGYSGQNYCVGGKVYSFILYDNNVPIFDAIPVRVGQVGYMYDKVSKQLFGNAGTGEFILGPDLLGGGKRLVINMLCRNFGERRAA